MFPGLPSDRVELPDPRQSQHQGQRCGTRYIPRVDSPLAWDEIRASEDLPAFQGQNITCWGPGHGTLLFSQGGKGPLRPWFVCFHSVAMWPQTHNRLPMWRKEDEGLACHTQTSFMGLWRQFPADGIFHLSDHHEIATFGKVFPQGELIQSSQWWCGEK